jgi:hypothetical protein
LMPVFDMLCDSDFWNRQIDERGGRYLHEQYVRCTMSIPQLTLAGSRSISSSLPCQTYQDPQTPLSPHPKPRPRRIGPGLYRQRRRSRRARQHSSSTRSYDPFPSSRHWARLVDCARTSRGNCVGRRLLLWRLKGRMRRGRRRRNG